MTMETAQFFSQQFSYKPRMPFKDTRLVITLFRLDIINWNEISNNLINMSLMQQKQTDTTQIHSIQSTCTK